jgi:hypothetical protein
MLVLLKKYSLANTGGKCKRLCSECLAHKQGVCKGCAGATCPDRQCPGTECARCAVFCGRAKDRIAEAVDTIGGYVVDMSPVQDEPAVLPAYLPSINRRIGKKIPAEAYLIPFYALFSFQDEVLKVRDVRSVFGISESATVIVGFGMKDDKISLLFEYMVAEKFIRIIKEVKGVDYWCTPCFSVFDISNCHDQVMNFKRQFWIGDIMRNHGFKVFQEALYTEEHAKHNSATMEYTLEIIRKKGIKNVCINLQLFNKEITEDSVFDFIMRLPLDVTILCYGLSDTMSESLRQYREISSSSFTNQFQRRS